MLFKQPLRQIQPQMTRAEVEMVVIAEGVGIETVHAKEAQLSIELRQLIEPEVHEEQMITKPMPAWQEPLMNDIAFVEGGLERVWHGIK
jgi:hypothetical protein